MSHALRTTTPTRRLPALIAALAGSALLLPTLGGCTTDQVVQDLRATNSAQEERLQRMSKENDDLREELRTARQRTAGIDQSMQGLRDENDSLLDRLSESDAQLQRLDRMLSEMAVVTLDADADAALRALANRNDAIQYDAALGVLRFSSDLTFASGSADVTSGARDAMADLADVLQDLDQPYELVVVGHTDNVRPSANTARRYPTNRALSVARAISVGQILVAEGIPGESILTGGWGEHRPLVENSATGGTAANRRVEITLTSATGSATAGVNGSDDPADTGRSSIPPITK